MSVAAIRAITPLFIAAIGGAIGIAVVLHPGEVNDAKSAAGFGLAGTALSGAAGLAQSGVKNSD